MSYAKAKSSCLQTIASRAHGVSLVSESGLYKLILRANASPTAKRFQDWVTKEVLPNIRKHGGAGPAGRAARYTIGQAGPS